MKIRELFRKPVFWIAVCLMVCSGASELSMSQWASAYAEAALGRPRPLETWPVLHVCHYDGNQPYDLWKIRR